MPRTPDNDPPPRRVAVTLSGGPFDGAIIFAPEGTVEAGLAKRKRFHVYEIKGRHGSYIGPKPMDEATPPKSSPRAGPSN